LASAGSVVWLVVAVVGGYIILTKTTLLQTVKGAIGNLKTPLMPPSTPVTPVAYTPPSSYTPPASSGGRQAKYKAPRSGGYGGGGGGYGGGDPGWYTSGANSSSGQGWTGSAGHHHCKKGQPDCWCTDPRKCVAQGVPPTAPGECKPQWGTKQWLGGGNYPSSPQSQYCPPGTA